MGTGSLDLADWRREVTGLYARVRSIAAGGDPGAAHGVWRAERDALFAGHPMSPLPPGDARRTTGLPVAAYDPDLRLTAPLEPAPPAEHVVVTGTDGRVTFTRLGTVTLPLGALDVWWLAGYGGGVWLPVRDGGSGTLSYGGGRYLLDTVKGADLGTVPQRRGSGDGAGALVVDLNFLYNPSCAYDEAWACPLPPAGNRLDAVLGAGEL